MACLRIRCAPERWALWRSDLRCFCPLKGLVFIFVFKDVSLLRALEAVKDLQGCKFLIWTSLACICESTSRATAIGDQVEVVLLAGREGLPWCAFIGMVVLRLLLLCFVDSSMKSSICRLPLSYLLVRLDASYAVDEI